MRKDKTRDELDLKLNSNRSIKYKLMVSSVILFILAVGFNTLFTLTSLEKLYIETESSEQILQCYSHAKDLIDLFINLIKLPPLPEERWKPFFGKISER